MQILVGRAGEQRIGLVLDRVANVSLCAQLVTVSGAPPSLLGVLRVGREIVGVLDVAEAIGRPSAIPYPERRLVHLADRTAELVLCWDSLDDVITVEDGEAWSVPMRDTPGAVKALVRVGEELVALLDPDHLLDERAAEALTRAVEEFAATT